MKSLLIVLLPWIILLAGCGPFSSKARPQPEIFITALWNVQTMFDAQEDGTEYADFRESVGWTAEKYAARLTTISGAILQMLKEEIPAGQASKTQAPDLIALTEVENAGVLEDLVGALSKQGYYWAAFANVGGAPLGLGFISRLPLLDIKAHSITIEKDTTPRPVLELRLLVREKPLVFLLCHWKSKVGGDDATEAQRRASARVVQRRLTELRESEGETPVIVLGDFNENHDDFYRRFNTNASASMLYALLPDDPEAAALAASAPGFLGFPAMTDFLVLSGEKPPEASYFPQEIPALYSPWEREILDGSYYFRDTWESIDNFLLSDKLFMGSGWSFEDCRVLNKAPFVTSRGEPNSYSPRSGRGLSDHLPLLLYLRYLPDDV